jgi:DNA-directed RNA polymerase subunit RPC12/RpoP
MAEKAYLCHLTKAEKTYLCQQCGNIFRFPVDSVPKLEKGLKCPRCGNAQIKEIPSWVPIGSDLHEGPTEWEYECQQCQDIFKLPIPSSPSQEKEIKCPACGGGHIHRITASGLVPLYCG